MNKIIKGYSDTKQLKDQLIKLLKESNKNLEENLLTELITHSTHVQEIALQIYNEIFKDNKDIRLVIAGSLLHDIRRYNEDGKKIKDNKKHRKSHNVEGADYIEENKDDLFKNFSFSNLEIQVIMKIVKYHKGKIEKYIEEDEKIKQLIEIVRVADKISKIYKTSKICNETYKEITEKINELTNSRVKEESTKVLDKNFK